MDPKKISIKELIFSLRLRELGFVFAFLIGIITITYKVTVFYKKGAFETKLFEKDQELEYYKSKWNQIRPCINKDFDLRNNVISIHSNNIPKNSQLINNEFVVQKEIKGLEYYVTSIDNYKKELSDISMSKLKHYFFDLSPIHIWKAKSTYTISDGKEIKKFSPYFILQKIPFSRLENKLIEYVDRFLEEKIGPSSNKKSMAKIQDKTSVSNEKQSQNSNFAELKDKIKQEFIEFIKKIERRDVVEIFYHWVQSRNLLNSIFDFNYDFESILVEKEKDFLHVQNLHIYNNYKFIEDDAEIIHPEFYVREQIILVPVGYYLYFISISISIPSFQITRDRYYENLKNQWITSLRLFAN